MAQKSEIHFPVDLFLWFIHLLWKVGKQQQLEKMTLKKWGESQQNDYDEVLQEAGEEEFSCVSAPSF